MHTVAERSPCIGIQMPLPFNHFFYSVSHNAKSKKKDGYLLPIRRIGIIQYGYLVSTIYFLEARKNFYFPRSLPLVAVLWTFDIFDSRYKRFNGFELIGQDGPPVYMIKYLSSKIRLGRKSCDIQSRLIRIVLYP
jgi:hypothetical protein